MSAQSGVVIVPMTVIEPAYFAETIGRLCEAGHDVRHFALLADAVTVRRRIRARSLFGLKSDPHALSRVDRCLERLREPLFADHINTAEVPVPAVADRIAESAGLTLAAATDGPLRQQLRRNWVSVKHIRFG